MRAVDRLGATGLTVRLGAAAVPVGAAAAVREALRQRVLHALAVRLGVVLAVLGLPIVLAAIARGLRAAVMREHVDFWHVTGDALDYSMAFHGIRDTSLREELMALYLRLRAYPDAVSCIEALAKTPFKMAILSNGTPAMLTQAATSAGIVDYFHEIISVEEVGIFKPDPRVYGRAIVRLHIDQPSAILFVSANPWDAQAAARFGFQVIRVDRFSMPDENLPGRPSVVIPTLADLAQIIAR
jgi:2-haloacid dehalogenase